MIKTIKNRYKLHESDLIKQMDYGEGIFKDYYVIIRNNEPFVVKTKFGRIKKVKLHTNSFGYVYLILCKKGVQKRVSLHRLVGLTFIPNPENKPEINHKNGVKTDNRITNLEWCTKKENIQHSFDMDLNLKGYKAPNIKPIAKYTHDGEFLKVIFGEIELRKEIKQNYTDSVRHCCKNIIDIAFHHRWQYANLYDINNHFKLIGDPSKMIEYLFYQNRNNYKASKALENEVYNYFLNKN